MKTLSSCLAGCCALLVCAPAWAQVPSREMATIWRVEPAPAPTDPLEVEAGGLVLKQRLLPTGLVRLTAPVTGDQALEAGTQLFEVKADVPVYCVAGRRETDAVTKFLFTGGNVQLCLVDADKDGAFEGYFQQVSRGPGIPMVGGKRPKSAKPIAPTPYEAVDPATVEKPFWVGIEYKGKPLLYDLRSFALSFGSDTSKSSLSETFYTEGSSYPISQTIRGASFTVLGVENDKLKVRVNQTLPAQTFGVVQITTFR